MSIITLSTTPFDGSQENNGFYVEGLSEKSGELYGQTSSRNIDVSIDVTQRDDFYTTYRVDKDKCYIELDEILFEAPYLYHCDGFLIQYELMQLIPELGAVESQNIHDRTSGGKGVFTWYMRTLNRMLRGGGMDYQLYSKQRNVNDRLLSLISDSLYPAIKDSPAMRESLIKFGRLFESR